MVTYQLPSDPLWLRTASAVAARLPRSLAQRLQDSRARVAVLLFATILGAACAVFVMALVRLAFDAVRH
jgi:hypothetical protein